MSLLRPVYPHRHRIEAETHLAGEIKAFAHSRGILCAPEALATTAWFYMERVGGVWEQKRGPWGLYLIPEEDLLRELPDALGIVVLGGDLGSLDCDYCGATDITLRVRILHNWEWSIESQDGTCYGNDDETIASGNTRDGLLVEMERLRGKHCRPTASNQERRRFNQLVEQVQAFSWEKPETWNPDF